MSGDKYFIADKQGCYFVTFTVIHWIDIFSRKEYRDIVNFPGTSPRLQRGLYIFYACVGVRRFAVGVKAGGFFYLRGVSLFSFYISDKTGNHSMLLPKIRTGC